MKSPFKKSTGSVAIESELGRLEAKLADHHRRRSEKLQQLTEVKTDRRSSWDQPDDITNKLTTRIRELTGDVAVLDEAITDLGSAIAETEDRLRRSREAEERDATVTAWEVAAKVLEGHKAEFEKGMAIVAKALQGIQAAVPADVSLVPIYSLDRPQDRQEGSLDHLSPREIAAAIAVEGLAFHCPNLLDKFSVAKGYQAGFAKLMNVARTPAFVTDHAEYEALAPGAAVDALLIKPLRKAAEDARKA